MGISSPGTDIYLCQKSETMKTGIFFGSTLGTTENIAGQIATALRISPDDIHNVADTDPSAVQGYDCLLLGSSTWGAGDLQDDWYDFIGKLKNENLSGKLVGLFGCGDSGSYPDTFCDAMGHLYDDLSGTGCRFIGACDTAGYSFDSSEAVRDGKFVVGNRAYSTFVIPDGTENIEGATFDLLKSFVAQGGKLIAFGCPSRVDGVVSPEVEAFCKSNSIAGGGLNTTASKTGLPVCTPEFIESNFRNDDIRFVTVSGGDLHHHRKEFADGQVLLLTNVSLDEPTAVEVALDGKYVVRMDALDGKTYQIPYTSGDGKVAVKTTIEPAGSVLLRVSDEPLAAEKAAAPKAE